MSFHDDVQEYITNFSEEICSVEIISENSETNIAEIKITYDGPLSIDESNPDEIPATTNFRLSYNESNEIIYEEF